MRHGNILLGVASDTFPGLLLIDATTGNSIASLTELSLFAGYSSLSNDNASGLVYDIVGQTTVCSLALSALRSG